MDCEDQLTLVVSVRRARLLGNDDEFNSYVTVKLQNVKSTTVSVRGAQPQWEQEFIFETNRPDESMSIELWSKGVLWDKLLGVALMPLKEIPFSAQPGAGRWLQIDAEVETRGGVTVGTRSPTGHSLLVEARFEPPFDAAAGDTSELLQSRLDQLNRLQLEVDAATLHTRAPLNHSGYSEDSDYTSDVSFPIHGNVSHHNSSVHQWDSHLHPHRHHHPPRHQEHSASYEGDEDAYNATQLHDGYDAFVEDAPLPVDDALSRRRYDSRDFDDRIEDDDVYPAAYEPAEIDAQRPRAPSFATAPPPRHFSPDVHGRYDSYRSEDESTYKGDARNHYDSPSAYSQPHDAEDEFTDEYASHMPSGSAHFPRVRNHREFAAQHSQDDESFAAGAARHPEYDYHGHNGYPEDFVGNGYHDEDEDRYVSDGGKGYTADFDYDGSSDLQRPQSSTWSDAEPLSYNSRPPLPNHRRILDYAEHYDDETLMNEEEEDRLREQQEREEEEAWRLQRLREEEEERQRRISDECPTYTEDRDYHNQMSPHPTVTTFAPDVLPHPEPAMPNHVQAESDARRSSGSGGQSLPTTSDGYNWRNDDRRLSDPNVVHQPTPNMYKEERPMVTIVEEPAIKEKRDKKELHDLWHWAYRQVCTNLGYKASPSTGNCIDFDAPELNP